MDYLELVYKDPLFSIIIIIAIITLVTLADYTKNKYKYKAKNQSLDDFAKSFENHAGDKNINELLHASKYPISTLIFIANVYVSNGNFSEAIKMFLNILDKAQNPTEKMQILESLGLAYYKAGFMQRAKNIFIEILKHNPREDKILYLLMQTYELLGEYKNALSVISCLEELDRDIEDIKQYMKIQILINDSLMSLKEREIEILKINQNSKLTNKVVLNYFKSYDINIFWELVINSNDIRNYIDLLWDIHHVPMDKIKEKKAITDVYRAKGLINDDVECDILELEALRVINKYSSKSANLNFKYKCRFCREIHPFEVSKCPNCSELGGIELILEITELNHEKNNSLL